MILSLFIILLVGIILLLMKNERQHRKSYYPPFSNKFDEFKPLDMSTRRMPFVQHPNGNRRKPRIVVIGAGWGGLTSAMLLQSRGFDVTIVEKDDQIGGRQGRVELGNCRLDSGPTILVMKYVLEETFCESGKKLADYVELRRLDPFFKIHFGDGRDMLLTSNHEKQKEEIRRLFPNEEAGLDRMMKIEKTRGIYLMKALARPYASFLDLINIDLMRSIPWLPLGRSFFEVLGDYFPSPALRWAFSFHSKYLGSSPWTCPGAYVSIPYFERADGIWYSKGGLSNILEAMVKVITEYGGTLRLSSTVQTINTKNGAATGVTLESGEIIEADDIIMNPDIAWLVKNAIDQPLKKWSSKTMDKMTYSCSTFMIYLNLNRKWPSITSHNNIVFPNDFEACMKRVCETGVFDPLSEEHSMYVCFPGVTDPSIETENNTAMYVLVSVPNRKINPNINWHQIKQTFKKTILSRLEKRLKLHNLSNSIVQEKVISPADWETDYNIPYGAVFGLEHKMSQLLIFRPPNKFEVENTWLVGSSNHPGAGIPTLIDAARIVTNYVCRKYDNEY